MTLSPALAAARAVGARAGAALVVVATMTACGAVPVTDVTQVPSATEVPTERPPAPVDTLAGVETAVVEILTEGTFVDPDLGELEGQSGVGSGFIIDPSGIAVTNNHVVTGAETLQVWVNGEGPREARFLGVSECSDLALIDIDGDDYPFLDWYEGDVTTGLEVYAAGFPELAEPPSEYTLTDGIVSQADANGETEWASVRSVIQHTARINPGNSGGPLVDERGAVVGINFANVSERDENYAIRRDEALEILDTLREGDDVASIGINGIAVTLDGDETGIWVSSVASGSPADAAGIEGGDVLTELDGESLAGDGTMADYCEVLRSHGPDDPLDVEVYRSETDEILAGTLNGAELEVVSTGNGGGEDDGFVTIEDETGTLTVDVPASWTDVNDGGGWVLDDEEVGLQLSASTDLELWRTTYEVPGVFFGVSADLFDEYTPEELLEEFDQSADCEYDGREEYSDGVYEGFQDFFVNCDDGESQFMNIAAIDSEYSQIAIVQVQVVSEEDMDAYERILETFISDRLP